MKSIIRELWKSKMKNNLEEFNKFVDTYNLLSKKNINYLNRSITINNIEAVIVSQQSNLKLYRFTLELNCIRPVKI